MSAPHHRDDTVTLWHGDCLDVLRGMADNSVDAVVTDPPYGLVFMGKAWDDHVTNAQFGAWCQTWATECLRVLKPGGHMLAFGGTRTWHRLAVAVEDAGFEIRDSIAWLYGSGFPKSLDVSKAIDKANGRQFEDRYALGRHIREHREAAGLTRADVNAWFGYRDGCEHWERQDPAGARVPTMADWIVLRERLGLSDEHTPLVERAEAAREVVGSRRAPGGEWTAEGRKRGGIGGYDIPVTAPATPEAEAWHGWGTALKPAFEPVVVARKPLVGTVAGNVLAYGTGALNIDGCRVEGGARPLIISKSEPSTGILGDGLNGSSHGGSTTAGRWPANVVLDESQAAELDRQSGERPSQRTRTEPTKGTAYTDSHIGSLNGTRAGEYLGETGGASRFFPTFRYEAKAPTAERPRAGEVAHPTVKPLDLMRWLVRLVTPPGGTVLEPFAGSGTTAEACVIEGFQCIAIEREADYLPLIVQRLSKPIQPGLDFGEATA